MVLTVRLVSRVYSTLCKTVVHPVIDEGVKPYIHKAEGGLLNPGGILGHTGSETGQDLDSHWPM